MDFIHVLEYFWKAAWCFYDKGDSAVEKWVAERAVKILHGCIFSCMLITCSHPS
jgi:hypothetical protein